MRAGETVATSLLPGLILILALFAGGQSSTPPPGTPTTGRGDEAGNSSGEPPTIGQLAAIVPVLDLIDEALGSAADTPESRGSAAKRLEATARLASTQWSYVAFLVVTIPDYVDSNAAWMTDEVLGAIQSALVHQGYVLERFWLPDLPRERGGQWSGATPAPGVAQRRAHESQPGALLFRSDQTRYVVLTVPETATSGIHVRAFENALGFVAGWQALAGASASTGLSVIGPTFSGSVDSLIAPLERVKAQKAFESYRIVSGSATHDHNQRLFEEFCRSLAKESCSYATAMHTNGVTVARLYDFLRRMNPSWVPRRVALFQEINTTYGQSFRSEKTGSCGGGADSAAAEACLRRYYFPLHVAQLRGDARAATPVPALLTTPAVALRLGEEVVPIDQLPPMRLNLASAVAERTMDAMLDDVRHQGFAAIGIYATDVRDVLFLSREIKRAAPDVQLFYPSGHLLYLHPDFIPYTRGAIVASTYPLSITQQVWGDASDPSSFPGRELFPSTVAQGVFNATRAQVAGPYAQLADYPDAYAYEAPSGIDPSNWHAEDAVNEPNLGPKPGLWLSVVGDDGFWAIEQDATPQRKEPFRPAPTRVPVLTFLAVGFLLTVALTHTVVLLITVKAGRQLDSDRWFQWLRETPVLNVLTPPSALPEFRRLHGLTSALAFAIVGTLVFWIGSVLLVHAFGLQRPPVRVALWLVPVLGIATAAVARGAAVSRWTELPPVKAREVQALKPARIAEAVAGASYALPLAFLLWWTIATFWLTPPGESRPLLAANRVIGGGIVSPGGITTLLLAVMYVPVAWSLQRLSTIGYGYATLARNSVAFKRVMGGCEVQPDRPTDEEDETGSLAALLDMPVRHLPRAYYASLWLFVTLVVLLVFRDGTTVDGASFKVFIALGSLLGATAGLGLLGQSIEIWRRLRRLLRDMGELPLGSAVARVSRVVDVQWSVSMIGPSARDLRLPLRVAQDLRGRYAAVPTAANRDVDAALAALPQDEGESRTRAAAVMAPAQTATWIRLWQLADAVVPVVEANRWGAGSGPCDQSDQTNRPSQPPSALSAYLDQCETFLAVQRALVLRGVVARIVSGVFSSMLCITLLTMAHLFYAFQGRSSFLTVDMMMLGVCALVAVWIMIRLDRDPILKLLWDTTAEHVGFNWGLVHRVTVYGVLPLIVVIGSLFPEVGEPLLRLLEPFRKLTSL